MKKTKARRRRRAPARELVLVAGEMPKKRAPSGRDWTKAKAAAFLADLAETCNVTHAAAAAGVSASCVYSRRQRDAAFRAAWRGAIATAYQRLELILLDRAFNGTEKIVTRKDGSEERMREYSDQLGLQLLKMHRATAVEAEAELPAADADELREQLVRKLMRLKRRIERDETGGDDL